MRQTLRTHWLLVTFLVVGFLLRLAMVVALPLPLMTFTDANVYVRAAEEYLFRPDEGRTAGYPLFLRLAHGVWADPIFPVLLQHLMALVACVGIYAIGRVVGVPRTLAAIAAGVWAVSIDWLWLEHQLLTETLAATLTVAALAVFALAPPNWKRPFLLAVAVGVIGAGLGMGAAFVRPALLAAMPGIGLAALFLLRLPWRARIVSGVVLVVVSVGLLGAYVKVQEDKTGFRGFITGDHRLGDYPGVAPIARCDRFKVPAGTRSLCQRTPPDQRPGSDFYYWDPTSPGRKLLDARPDLAPAIRLWADRADSAQAGDRIREKLIGFQRLFGFGGLVRPGTDQGTEMMDLDHADVGPAEVAVQAIQQYYGKDEAPNKPARSPYGVLEALQPWTRPPGLLLLLSFLIAAAGVLVGRGAARRATFALGVAAWLPVLSATWAGSQYNWRYVLPSIPLIALATATGLTALWLRRSSRDGENAPVAPVDGPGEGQGPATEKAASRETAPGGEPSSETETVPAGAQAAATGSVPGGETETEKATEDGPGTDGENRPGLSSAVAGETGASGRAPEDVDPGGDEQRS